MRIIERVIIAIDQPIGQTRYKNVRLGYSGKINNPQTILNIQVQKNDVTVGIIGFLIPLNAPHKTSCIPQIKYNLEISFIFCPAYSITTGFGDIIEQSSAEKKADVKPNTKPNNTAIKLALKTVSLTLL